MMSKTCLIDSMLDKGAGIEAGHGDADQFLGGFSQKGQNVLLTSKSNAFLCNLENFRQRQRSASRLLGAEGAPTQWGNSIFCDKQSASLHRFVRLIFLFL